MHFRVATIIGSVLGLTACNVSNSVGYPVNVIEAPKMAVIEGTCQGQLFETLGRVTNQLSAEVEALAKLLNVGTADPQ